MQKQRKAVKQDQIIREFPGGPVDRTHPPPGDLPDPGMEPTNIFIPLLPELAIDWGASQESP